MMDAISVKNISKAFKDNTAVDKLSFSVPKNNIFGLLGSNGAGKTTTINMITGLLLPDSGSIKVNGLDTSKDIEKIRESIALVPQSLSLYEGMTVYENLDFFGSLYISDPIKLDKEIKAMLKLFELTAQKDKLVSELSGGYQRRCSIGCALIANPKILFLDEPLTGIDMYTNNIIMKFIKSVKNMTVIFTTHSIKEAESVCNTLVFMHNGKKILEGTPKEIVTRFSKQMGEQVVVEFDSADAAVKADRHVRKSHFRIIDLRIRGRKLIFNTKDIGNTVVKVMDSLNYLSKNVVNIDIVKPDLKLILGKLMDHENKKRNQKRV